MSPSAAVTRTLAAVSGVALPLHETCLLQPIERAE